MKFKEVKDTTVLKQRRIRPAVYADLVRDFLNSHIKYAEVIDFSDKSAKVIASGLRQGVKSNHWDHIVVTQRGKHVYLINELIE